MGKNWLITLAKNVWIILVLALAVSFAQGVEAQSEDSAEFVFNVQSLNEGMARPLDPPNLETPQAAVEHFILSAQQEAYETAAQALNFNRIPLSERETRAAELAERLHYVMRKELIWGWESLPDRPDGVIDHGVTEGNLLAGEPRRSFHLGSIPLDGRDIAFRVDRLQVAGEEPVWMVSANTVENIDLLYERYGPTEFDKMLPDWTKESVGGAVLLWELFVIVVLASLAVFVGWSAYKRIPTVVNKLVQDSDHIWLRNIGGAVPGPAAFLLALLTFFLPIRVFLSLAGPLANWLNPIFSILIVVAGTWLGMRIIHYISECWGAIYEDRLEEDNSLEARKMLTYISVAKRALILIAVLIGVGMLFAQFDSLQVFGFSMLASAGVASVVVGIAAQPVLSNIIAGVQVALTQPVRIGDNVMFEDEWGWIEEITYTFVTIRTWDKRRFVVPVTYLIRKPLENWSKNDATTIRPIYLYADYHIDVDLVRETFIDMVKKEQGDDYEEESAEVWVTDMKDDAVEIRATCQADNPSEAWDLHVKLREQLNEWLQGYENGRYLPRRRLHMVEGGFQSTPSNGSQPYRIVDVSSSST